MGNNFLNKVLDSIAPGASHSVKARTIGVTRQTLYDWKAGKYRPSRSKAKRLSKLTGIPWRDIWY